MAKVVLLQPANYSGWEAVPGTYMQFKKEVDLPFVPQTGTLFKNLKPNVMDVQVIHPGIDLMGEVSAILETYRYYARGEKETVRERFLENGWEDVTCDSD